MAENRARHAFGMLENIDEALAVGKIDSYDILFVKDADGKPYVGWIDRDGNKVICDDSAEFAELLEKIATKASTEDLAEVDAKIDEVAQDVVASANAYTDKMLEVAMEEHLTKKYEITNVPVGTIVDYRDSEIRVMVPAGAEWAKQNVGEGGDANSYYCTFKTYCPEGAVGYMEHLGNQVDSEILTNLNTDEHGRKYQPTWLALAKYDETAGSWTYYGEKSTVNHYIGWDYQIDWFNSENVMIGSDCIRINLSNENCHATIEPYYVSEVKTEVEAMIDKKIAEASIGNPVYEIVEF